MTGMDPVKVIFTLAVTLLVVAILAAVVPPGQVTYRSHEVIGPVPQEPGVTTYAR